MSKIDLMFKKRLSYLIFCILRLGALNTDHLIEVTDRRGDQAVWHGVAVVFAQNALFVGAVVPETFALKGKSSCVVSTELFTVV